MNEHPSEEIVIKKAVVDIKMVPVVNWLNSFEGVATRWCCQGSSGGFEDEPPYVVFYCESPLILAQILQATQAWGKTTVEFFASAGCIRYIFAFHTEKTLEEFKDKLAKNEIFAY